MLIFDAKIISNQKIAKNIYLLCLESEEIATNIKPGQFLMLKVSPFMDSILRRPFSICLIEPMNKVFILYKIRGKVTKLMSVMKEGEYISVIGPLGKSFNIPKNRSHIVLLAGGIGIAPLIFLGHQFKEKKITFIAGYNTVDEIIDLKKLLIYEYSYFIATEDGSLGFHGTAVELFQHYIKDKDFSNLIVVSCGPIAMLKKVVDITKKIKIPCYVFLETRMACGIGLCQGCVIEGKQRYLRVCKEGPVFCAEEICWEKM